ncbi:unnamed protein product [Rotaria sordida]|uniref:RIMS-binding protein 2 n=1 Tax=Rotaria sordida TaxID=392033 RepID=A0A813PWL0_9BILA|nr:unnamed protein product [Rotaria sordida]
MITIDNQHVYDEQEQTLQRQNIELHDRVKRFEWQLEVLKQDQPKDHDKELIKRALAKQASKDAVEYQKLLKQKNQEIEQLNIRLEQLSKSNLFESALRQANIEKLYLERRLLASTITSSSSSSSSSSLLSLNSRTNGRPSTAHNSSNINEPQPYITPTSTRSRTDSSTTHSIDPFHYQALQDTNEALKSEVHRLARSDEDNTEKLKLQLQKYAEFEEAYKQLQDKYTHLIDVEEHFNELQTIYKNEKLSNEYCLRENEQLKNQNEHLLNELARLTQVETRDRTRSIEQADLHRQCDDLLIQYNELKLNYNELKEKYQENQISYENDIKHLNDENLKFRLENEQLHAANDLLRDERNQMKESHETILKKRLDEIKYLQIENRDLQIIRQKYNEERETFQAIDLRKTQLENDLLTMNAVEDRCQDLQTTVERLESEVQYSQKKLDDHAMALTNLNKENARLIKELESASMLNTQMRAEISNATNTNERLTQDCDRYRTNLLTKSDEYDIKRRENEQYINKVHELESIIKSLRDTSDLHKQLNVENEVNKLELKRKQDDFEQFQKMHDTTKQENQETIHLLEEKIHDLERKTELQSLKHEEILLEFESLKARRDRILPSSTGTILSNNHPNIFPLIHHWPMPTMVDSQTSPTDDNIPPLPSPPIQQRPLLKSTGSQSITANENQEIKIKSLTNNQTAQIVIAKYSYEPLQCSPNDHPEVELPLNVGEYYLIYGDVDEDGFYDGRNLEGRYGLIPSNFIEKITNSNDLPETVRHIIQRLTGKIFSEETMTSHCEQTPSIDSDVFPSNTLINTPTTYRKQITPIQNGNPLDISTTTNSLTFGKHVPYPTNLRVEKYLTNSILIAWNSPSTTIQILGYQVLLDHSLYTTIRANERTRALIENINLNEKFHRISIRTISQHGLSRDQECTLLLTMSGTNGNLNDLSYAPSDLRVDRINQTSAVVSWWPASNDIVHKLFVNDIEVQTLKAGVYRFKLSGLLPNTIHKVTIKAKPNNIINTQQSLATSIEFCTTSFDESIEPPKRVQAIAGPQSNTLLVSWEQPLSTTTTARGYRVLVDGRQIQDIINPLNDHTVINMNSLHQGRFLTVRTLTENDGESHDSIPIDLDEILKKLDVDIPSITVPVLLEETFDKESIPLTASSSLTLRTTSDDELTNAEQQQLFPTPPAIIETPQKSSTRSQEISSPSTTSISSVKQSSTNISQAPPNILPPSPIKSTTTSPDKIRPITKTSTRPIGIPPIQSPLKSSSTTSSVNTDVPQIEINSPSPNSSGIATTTTTTNAIAKSKLDNRDHYEQPPQRFGYDAYIKQSDDSTSHIKSSNTQRKTSKASTTMSPIKQRDHSDSRRTTTATPMNGNLNMNKTKISSPRHASTSSEEQHVAPPTPMKTVKLKEQIPTQPLSSVNSHLYNKTNNPPRLFIALFDYDPNAMSPNKDNEEELPFKEGQLIRIYGDQDADGFYVGQTENGRTGYVPSNMVSEIQLDDAEIEAHLLAGTINLENPNRVPSTTTATTTTKRILSGTNSSNIKSSAQSVKKMVAMFDYNPRENSPNINPDEELSFRTGDIIYVQGNVHDDGFYFGELENGTKGLVPSNFLKEVSLINTDENIIQQDNEQMITNENKKTSYRRGPHQV